MTIEAAGYIVHTSEAIYGAGETEEAAWKQAEEYMDPPEPDTDDSHNPLHREPEIEEATAALLAEVAERGGAISWSKVSGICCTLAEEEEYGHYDRWVLERSDVAKLTALDLSKEAAEAAAKNTPVHVYFMTELDAHGYRTGQPAQMLWYPDDHRAGIAWGADADWTDASSPRDAMHRWLDDEMSA